MSVEPAQFRIATVGVGQRQRAAFGVAFKYRAGDRYALIDEAAAQPPHLGIVDVDSAPGFSAWERFRDRYPGVPAVLLSFDPVRIPDGVFVKKPLSVDRFLSVLDWLSESVNEPAADAGRDALEDTQDEDYEFAELAAGLERRHKLLLPDDERRGHERVDAHLHPPNSMFGVLQRILQSGQAAWIDGEQDEGMLAVLPRVGKVFVQCNEAQLRHGCSNGQRFFHRPLSTAAERAMRDQKLLSLERYVWQIGLWTNAGRQPHDIDATHSYFKLLRWPSFTRCDVDRDMLRIAAMLSKVETNVSLVVKMLRVDECLVFDFVEITRSLGMLRQIDRGHRPLILPTRSEPPAKKRRVLDMLLRKLVNA